MNKGTTNHKAWWRKVERRHFGQSEQWNIRPQQERDSAPPAADDREFGQIKDLIMGDWGVGVFQNDAALNFLIEVQAGGLAHVRQAVRELTKAAAHEPLERDDGNVAVAIAGFAVAYHRNRSQPGNPQKHGFFQSALNMQRVKTDSGDAKCVNKCK